MQYKGPLWGRVAGKFIKLENDTDYYDSLQAENSSLREVIANREDELDGAVQLIREKKTENERLKEEADKWRIRFQGTSFFNMDEELKNRNEALQTKLDRVREYCEEASKKSGLIHSGTILDLLK